MATCKLCRRDRILVKAHVIPRSFFRELGRGESGSPIIVSNKRGAPPKRVPMGVYDKTILCRECEQRFGQWDDYAARFLIQGLDKLGPMHHEGRVLAFTTPLYDYATLKLFFISVLWRASVSTMTYFRRVTLGPLEEDARQSVLLADGGAPDHFGIVIARRVASAEMAKYMTSMICPFREQYDGIDVYRLYFGQVVAYIKVDRRPFLPPFDELQLRPGALMMLAQEFDNGKDIDAMRKIVRMNQGR